MKASLECHLKDKGYNKGYINSLRVSYNQTRFNSQTERPQVNGTWENRRTDEKDLIMTWQLGITTPFSLQFSLFRFFTKGFGRLGRQDYRLLMFGVIELNRCHREENIWK